MGAIISIRWYVEVLYVGLSLDGTWYSYRTWQMVHSIVLAYRTIYQIQYLGHPAICIIIIIGIDVHFYGFAGYPWCTGIAHDEL